MKYTVIELQNGIVGENVWTYDNINDAEAKYHSVLSVAANSSVDVHAAALLNETGYCVKHESYDHRPVPVVPDEE